MPTSTQQSSSRKDGQNNSQNNSLDACNPRLNATVSASAGSGKTWLLITRIVRLLIDGAEPGNIIALTFTRKAAGEMQIRLNERLYEMATADDDDLAAMLKMTGCEDNNNNRTIAAGLYEKLMHSLYPIRIQTFHAFCQDILSSFPLEAGIPPGFELSEDTSLLQNQAWQSLFQQAGTENAALDQALDFIMQVCNGPDNTRTALNNFMSQRSDWWAYTAHASDTVSYAVEELSRALQIDTTLIESGVEPTQQFFDDLIIQKLKNFSGLLLEINNKNGNRHAAIIDHALVMLTGTDDTVFDEVFRQIRSAFLKKDGDILIQGRKHNATLEKKLGSENTQRFLSLHLEIATKIQALDEQLKRLLCLKINKAWYLAGQRYVDIYQKLKAQQRLLDFTDLEWKCYRLLQQAGNISWVQYKIDQRIDHLLIDEFQDTNPTQWHLLSPILEEIAANPEQRQRSIFLVGDEKQSIYSFRRANPALQAQASRWLADNLQARATPLDFSRRSSAAIIHCVNQVFQQPEVSALLPGFTKHDTHLSSLPGKVQLCDLFEEDADEEENTSDEDIVVFRNPLVQPRVISRRTLRHKEADYIARQIRQLIDDATPVTDDEDIRSMEYSDIMILMRNRTHIAIYEDALKKHAIPFIGNKKGGLLDKLEIQDLICLLDTLSTPYNNLALAQVLKSPIFAASDEDLTRLAETDTKNSSQWYEKLLRLHAERESSTTPISEQLQRAATLLPRWQKLAEQLPVHDCLDRIFSEGNIINRYIAANTRTNRQKAAANCKRFLELSLETDSGRYPSITRFLQRLDHLQINSDNPPEEALTQNNESRVRLMTIHGSKGLEAPVVFLADCNSTSRNKNAYSALVRWPAEKLRPTRFQLQLGKDNTDEITQRLHLDKQDEQSREDLNLLYVALTRAREQMYISGVVSSRSRENSWYQIISSGLEAVTQTEQTPGDISCRVYRHLAYPQSEVTKTDQSRAEAEYTTKKDKRLLVPIKNPETRTFIIAPSQQDDVYESGLIRSNHKTGNDDARRSRWRGKVVHGILEKLCLSNIWPATEQHIAVIRTDLNNDTSIDSPAYLDETESCIQEAASLFNDKKFESIFNPPVESRTFNEMPIMYAMDKRAVYGIIDRLIKSEHDIQIIDYKSHRLEPATLQEVASQFNRQLTYYRTGVEQLWPDLEVKTGVLFTYHKELIWL